MKNLDRAFKLLAAAEGTAAATADMIEEARSGAEHDPGGNVGSGDTLAQLADSLRLLLDSEPDRDQEGNRLHAAVIRYLDQIQ